MGIYFYTTEKMEVFCKGLEPHIQTNIFERDRKTSFKKIMKCGVITGGKL